MNLLMISLHADPTFPAGIGEGGGTHSYIRELLTYFSSKDINILLITRKSHPSLSENEIIADNCNIQRIIIKDENPIDKKEFYNLHNISLHRTESALEKWNYKPDLIHSIYWNSGQVAKDLSSKLGIPFVHTVISNGLRRQEAGMSEAVKQRFKIEKEIFQAAAYIFCITPSERKDLVELYQIDAKKIMIPGRPISEDFLYPSHDAFGMPYRFNINKKDVNRKSHSKLECTHCDNSPTNKWWQKQAFLYCGRLAANKGVDVVLSAWYQLKAIYQNQCPALWIAGGSPDEIVLIHKKLREQYDFEQHEECGNLIWWGYLDQRGISTLMLKSHALIMHSSYEPGGRVIIEALASGIPVIATFCGFGVDYICDWYNGFQVPFGNINLLRHIMSLFVKQPYLSNCLGINAKKYMQRILKEWDFYNSHQSIYTIAVANIKKDFQNSGYIKYCRSYKNYMNIYPYFNDIITDNLVKEKLEIIIQENVYQIESVLTEIAAVWTAKSASEEYEIWQPYTRIMDTSYLYSFIETIVDKRSNQYEREKYASNLNINPVLEYIDEYYIYIKKKFTLLNGWLLNKEVVQVAVKGLFNSFYCQKAETIQKKLQRLNRDWHNSSIDDIKIFYDEYYRNVPSYIYHSYNINYSLSSRQLYFIMTDQRNIVPKELFLLYLDCEEFLNTNISKNSITYGVCLEDCSIENIIYDEKHTKCMFRNASSLYWGDVLRMTAAFLHSYLLFLVTSNEEPLPLHRYIDIFITNQDKELCIHWLFVIIFEKLVLYQNTLENVKYNMEFEILTQLKEIYINQKTS